MTCYLTLLLLPERREIAFGPEWLDYWLVLPLLLRTWDGLLCADGGQAAPAPYRDYLVNSPQSLRDLDMSQLNI